MYTSEQAELERKLAEHSGELLRAGYHCSEAVVLAVAPHVVPDWNSACARLSTGFAGGLGGTQLELCGALAGGVMVIGALYGRSMLQNDDLAQLLTKRFRERFFETFGTTQCQRLRKEVVEPDGGLGSCAVLVPQVTQLLLAVLRESRVRILT